MLNKWVSVYCYSTYFSCPYNTVNSWSFIQCLSCLPSNSYVISQFSLECSHLTFKLILKAQKFLNCQRNIEKKTKTGDTTLSDFRLYTKKIKVLILKDTWNQFFIAVLFIIFKITVIDLDIFCLLIICSLLWIWFWSPRKYNASLSFATQKTKD